MKDTNLNKEIEEASKRIEERQAEIAQELTELATQIENYTTWAWKLVWLGATVAGITVIHFIFNNTDSGFGLNLLGDSMAGTVASIWSLAGLFLIYVAFLGQKQQLLNQQLEIMYSQLEVKYTRLELTGQKEEMVAQNKTLRQQKFENTFFQLLTLFSSIVNSMDLRRSKSKTEVISTGRDCFEIFYNRLRNNLVAMHHRVVAFKQEEATIDQVLSAFEALYQNDKSDMSHYFRTIYHIIKFIDRSDIENKKQYIAITRAQLSSYEQILLFYNCLHENGVEKFKPLIEKYALFKNIDGTLLINQQHLLEYKDGAYGRVT